MCHVQTFSQDNTKFDVQEIASHHLRRRPMSFKVKLNEWWCDCGEFQALRLSCPYVIVVCSFCHFNLFMFVDPVYSLQNIYKAYEMPFHPLQNEEYWSTYNGPNFIPDPHMRRKAYGRPPTARLHNEMDEPINKPKKCSYCRNEGHNRTNTYIGNKLCSFVKHIMQFNNIFIIFIYLVNICYWMTRV